MGIIIDTQETLNPGNCVDFVFGAGLILRKNSDLSKPK